MSQAQVGGGRGGKKVGEVDRCRVCRELRVERQQAQEEEDGQDELDAPFSCSTARRPSPSRRNLSLDSGLSRRPPETSSPGAAHLRRQAAPAARAGCKRVSWLLPIDRPQCDHVRPPAADRLDGALRRRPARRRERRGRVGPVLPLAPARRQLLLEARPRIDEDDRNDAGTNRRCGSTAGRGEASGGSASRRGFGG